MKGAGGTLALLLAAALAGPSVDPEDPALAPALQELDAAGVPQDAHDLASFIAEPAGIRPKDRTWSGRWYLQTEPTSAGGWDPRLRGSSTLGRWSGRLHLRRRDEERLARGHLAARVGSLSLAAGDLGLAWGAGLLSSGPASRTGLYAGTRLGRWRTERASGGSSAEARAVTGVYARAEAAAGQVMFLVGRPQKNGPAGAGRRLLSGLRWAVRSGKVGLLALADDQWRGGSCTVDLARGEWTARFESARAVPRTGAMPHRSLTASVAFPLPYRGLVEAVAAQAAGGDWPQTGARPAVLCSDVGFGWALRCSLRPAPSLRWCFLAGRSRGQDPGFAAAATARDLREVEGSWRPARGWSLGVRWRSQLRWDLIRSERFPWQPVSSSPQRLRGVWTATVARRSSDSQFQALLRGQTDRDGIELRTRRLLQLTARRRLTPALRVRGVWAAAWGGDADLVSAVSPLSGMLLPRHWGHWSGELQLGIEWRTAAIRWGAAVSRRTRAAPQDRTDELAGWAGGEISF